jgi:phosphatidylinositol alpha-1,6-mannosyltransferase
MEISRKILFVTRNFPPLTGGIERLSHHAFKALHAECSVAMCGPQGAGGFLPEGTKFREVPPVPISRFLIGCQWEALKLALNISPNVIYSCSGLTAPAALMAGSISKAPTLCFLHGLDIVADHPIYRALFLPAIRRIDHILVNSHHTACLAESAGVQAGRIEVIHPGVELPDWFDRQMARERFRKNFGLGDGHVLLAVGRLTKRKGLAEFIRFVLPAIRSVIPDVQLLVIGSEASNALKQEGGVRTEIVAAIGESDMDPSVTLLGSVEDDCLSDAYFAADAMVFPVLDLPGDVEGFGMVAVEAAAHGLPTVAFAVGGVSDAVANGESGWLIPPGEYAEMIHKTLSLLSRNERHVWADSCRRHAERFTWQIFGQKLMRAITMCLKEQRRGG